MKQIFGILFQRKQLVTYQTMVVDGYVMQEPMIPEICV